MKRHEFLDQLWVQLEDIAPTEKIKLIEYYNELYYDKLDSGESEENIVADFGTPEEAAKKYLLEAFSGEIAGNTNSSSADSGGSLSQAVSGGRADLHQVKETGKGDDPYSDKSAPDIKLAFGTIASSADTGEKTAPDKKYVAGAKSVTGERIDEKSAEKKSFLKNKTFWTIYFAAFLITFPLTIAAFAVGIGLIAAVFAILISLIVGAVAVCISLAACIAAGIYGIVSSFAVMTNSFPVGLAQLGISFAAIAVGLVGLYLTINLFKLVAKLWKRRKNHGKN